MGLVLQRRIGEAIVIGDSVTVRLKEFRGAHAIALDIDAPKNVRVDREEIRSLRDERDGQDESRVSNAVRRAAEQVLNDVEARLGTIGRDTRASLVRDVALTITDCLEVL